MSYQIYKLSESYTREGNVLIKMELDSYNPDTNEMIYQHNNFNTKEEALEFIESRKKEFSYNTYTILEII